MSDAREPLAAGPRADARRGAARLPNWMPSWVQRFAELYFSGTTSMFILHGNTLDFVRLEDGANVRYGGLAEFLAEQLFGRWDLVLHYDLARGLRVLAGSKEERLKEMVGLATRKIGDLGALPKDPAATLALLDHFVTKNIMVAEAERVSLAVIVDHASYIAPSGEPGHMSLQTSINVVTLLNWATSPYAKRLNMAFLLLDEQLTAVNERLTTNPHVACIEILLPEAPAREQFIRSAAGNRDITTFADFGIPDLARLTAGISLTDLNILIRSSAEGGRRLDQARFQDLKKHLIERQCQGLLEFIEPKWGLDSVIGHDAAKSRLSEDAALLKRGALDSLPMGYLVCGPVGTGKTFLAQCASGSIGIPCVILKNFRSKYVGETEGNLERVLSVLRAMGPVVVIVDEADAALGDRDQEGDSGTSSRVFAMIAAQMGDTRYRGQILWMLLTCRPDLLPIDIKRQGRAEVHIPLFYPSEEGEIREIFVVMAKKLGTRLALDDVPTVPQRGDLSGADIEGIVTRAWRRSLLASADHVTPQALGEAITQFMPSTQGLERELQEVAAIIECTDRQFLPPPVVERIEAAGGHGKLQERLTTLKRLVQNL